MMVVLYLPKEPGSYKKRDLHFFLKETTGSIDVNIDTPNIESVTKGFEIKKYPASGTIKIIIKSIDDLKKLDKLIVTCFDEVNK